ncbi:histidine kinase [Streptomyces sp. NPDC002073]
MTPIPVLAARLRAAVGPRAADLALALLVQVAVTIPFVVPRDPDASKATWLAYGLTSVSSVPLVWRRRAPVLVAFGVIAAGGLYRFTVDGPGQPLPYAGLVAFYTVALLCTARVRFTLCATVTAVVVVSVALNTRTAMELLFSLFVFGAAYTLGRLQHTRQAYLAAIEDRAAQLERTRRIEAEQAAARERARIAREMHDILSHAVSIMIVQAEAGPLAVRRAPERAEAAFEAISETGRDAMTQLRRMLGVLRAEDGGAAGGGAGGAGVAEGAAPRAPQPGVAVLPALLDRVRLGGPRVRLEERGEVRPLPPAVDTTVYRVVQEALTNVVKHAAATTVTVLLDHGPGEVTVTVTDDGRGPRTDGPRAGVSGEDGPRAGVPGEDGPRAGVSGEDGPRAEGGRESARAEGPGTEHPRTSGAGGGHGLIGIRERAAAHGGTATAGPGPGGQGFEVRVRLVVSPLEVGS